MRFNTNFHDSDIAAGLFVSPNLPLFAVGSGISSAHDLVQCEHTRVAASVSAPFGATVDITQVFKVQGADIKARVTRPDMLRMRNPDLEKLQTAKLAYRFPNPTTGAVVAFRATVNNDRVIVGKVKPADAAREEYKDTLENHKDKAAGLATAYTRDIFQIDLGNIPWCSTVKVEIVS